MPILIYEVVTNDGYRPVRAWALGLNSTELGKLNHKLDMLENHGDQLGPQLLTGTPDAHIDKIRVRGPRALRLLLCRGPLDMRGSEFTLLHGCIEKDRKLPKRSIETAADLRERIINAQIQRVRHERFKRNAS